MREIERGVVGECCHVVGAPRRSRRGPADRAVSKSLNDQPPQRNRQLTQARQRDLLPRLEQLAQQGVEHLRLVAEDRRQRQHVLLGARMDLPQRRHHLAADSAAGVLRKLVGRVLPPLEAPLNAIGRCVLARVMK